MLGIVSVLVYASRLHVKYELFLETSLINYPLATER